MIKYHRSNTPAEVDEDLGDVSTFVSNAARSWLFPVLGVAAIVGLMWYARKK